MASVPVRQLSWSQSTAVSPHRPHLLECAAAAGAHHPLKGVERIATAYRRDPAGYLIDSPPGQVLSVTALIFDY